MAGFLEPTVSSIEALFTRFTWRRFLALLVILGLTGLGLLSFEIYSGHLELSRLQKAATVLNTLRQVDSVRFRSDTNLTAVRHTIGRDLRLVLDARVKARNDFSTRVGRLRRNGVAPIVAGGLVWWVLALAGIRRLLDRNRGALQTFLLLVLVGWIAGVVGTLLPYQRFLLPFWIIYPLVSLVTLGLLIVFTGPPRN